MEQSRPNMPEDYIREMFHALTERGMQQINLHDSDTIDYITNMLAEFVRTENMDRINGGRTPCIFEFLDRAADSLPTQLRRDYYRHLGDLTLFKLGMFPEGLTYGRHTVSPDFYAERGRRCYDIVAGMCVSRSTIVFRKLSEQFTQCVAGLNWVKLYTNDPFYQYMFRQFNVVPSASQDILS